MARRMRWGDPAAIMLAVMIGAMMAFGRWVDDKLPAQWKTPYAAAPVIITTMVVFYLIAVLFFTWMDAVAAQRRGDESRYAPRIASLPSSLPLPATDATNAANATEAAGTAGTVNTADTVNTAYAADAALDAADAAQQAHAVNGTAASGSGRAHPLAAMMRSWTRAQRPTTFTATLRTHGIRYALVAFGCWLPWIAVCWPGILRDDTVAQFIQSSGAAGYYTQHPILDTLIFGFFWWIGSLMGHTIWGACIYVVVQAALMSLCVAMTLCYVRKLGAPRLLVGVLWAYYALDYVVVGSVPVMAKDSLNVIVLVPFMLICVEACLTRGRLLRRRPVWVAMLVLAALNIMTKRTGEVIVLVAFVAIITVCRGVRIRTLACLMAALIVVHGVWNPLSIRLTDAWDNPTRDLNGLIMQPVARIQHEDPRAITGRDRADLYGLMNLDTAGKIYNPRRSDEVSWTVRLDASAEQRRAALNAWLRLCLAHPIETIKAYGNIMLYWFNPDRGVFYGWNTDYVFDEGYMLRWEFYVSPPHSAAESVGIPLQRPAAEINAAKPWWVWVIGDAMRDRMNAPNGIASYAYYVTYIPLALLLYCITRRRRLLLAAWMPLAATVFVLYASPIVLPWYALPLFHVLPLFVGMTASRNAGSSHVNVEHMSHTDIRHFR